MPEKGRQLLNILHPPLPYKAVVNTFIRNFWNTKSYIDWRTAYPNREIQYLLNSGLGLHYPSPKCNSAIDFPSPSTVTAV